MSAPILQPAEWGMRWARPPIEHVGMPVAEVYVHQTAGRDPVETFPSGDDRPQDAFRALNEYAITGKGYSAVDYSMLVHTGPSMRTTIGVARGEFVPAATKDRNGVSKAVCLCGWFGPPDPRYAWTFEHAREPFPSELEAIAEAIVYMIEHRWLRRDVRVLGHRDNPAHPAATACPGDYLQAELPTIRRLVAQLLEQPTPAPTPTPTPGDQDMGPKIIIDDPVLKAAFTLDGVPVSPETLPVLRAQGYELVRQDHPEWRAAILHRNGTEAARLYGERIS